MAENNTSNIGFEKQIWDAACVLRGNIDASEYKSVVLGLIFLKYISDRFEAKYKELVEEGDGFEEDQDEYTAENIFFVPENARWSAIAAAPLCRYRITATCCRVTALSGANTPSSMPSTMPLAAAQITASV